MDGVKLQTIVYKGYAKAAVRIGLSFNQFRPTSANTPLSNALAAILAAFDSSNQYTFKSPNEYGDPIWIVLADGTLLKEGDYLVGNNGLNANTYFIAAKQPLLPILAIDCNGQIKIDRQIAPISVGTQSYGGMNDNNAQTILGNNVKWPASILLGGRSQSSTGLPAGVKNAAWRILLPPSVPVVIQSDDIITDNLNRRFSIEAAELTDLGWRIQAQEIHA